MLIGKRVDFEVVVFLEFYDGLNFGPALTLDQRWVRVRAIANSLDATHRSFLVEEIEELSEHFHQEIADLRRIRCGSYFLFLETNEFRPSMEAEFRSAKALETYLSFGSPYPSWLSIAPVSGARLAEIFTEGYSPVLFRKIRDYVEEHGRSRKGQKAPT